MSAQATVIDEASLIPDELLEQARNKRPANNKSVVLLSGGIDSTVAMYEEKAAGRDVTALIFGYGQTLEREVAVAIGNSNRLGVVHHVILADLRKILPGNVLLGQGDRLPMGRDLDAIQKAGTPPTYVPFRNGIFLAYAAAFCEHRNINRIVCGGNGLNSGNYWDDTEEFARAFENAIECGTAPKFRCELSFPNANRTKAQVAQRGIQLGVCYRNTFSCYTRGRHHCGHCDSCIQRRAALESCGLNIEGDPL